MRFTPAVARGNAWTSSAKAHQHKINCDLFPRTHSDNASIQSIMENSSKSQSALFDVYLRLRPPPNSSHLYPTLPSPDRFLSVEEAAEDANPTHITLNPPNDNRRRAIEKFAFTQVFEENATQLDIFHGTGVQPLIKGVLGANNTHGRDGLLATLGVTGSGKVWLLSSVPMPMLISNRVIPSWDLEISAASHN